MSKSNENKSKFLGVPFGTACHRLRKNILFRFLVKSGENFCFKCSEIIGCVDDLSVEHKLPWEGRDVALFWDLDNIAFSHLRCNRPHKHGMQKYFEPGEALIVRRANTARYMRNAYTTEKRREKFQRTGHKISYRQFV